jgi:hypothetical protein
MPWIYEDTHKQDYIDYMFEVPKTGDKKVDNANSKKFERSIKTAFETGQYEGYKNAQRDIRKALGIEEN